MKDTRFQEAVLMCLMKVQVQQKLAKKVMPELPLRRAEYYISRWKHGYNLTMVKAKHVRRVCKIAEVDPNWIYNYKPEK